MFSTNRSHLIIVIMLFGVFVLSPTTWAQNEAKTDSLHNSFMKAEEDTTKIDILIDLGLSYGQTTEKNLEFQLKALELAKKINDIKRIGGIEWNISSHYYYTGRYEMAILHTQKAADIYLKGGDTVRHINSVNNLGILFRRLGNLGKSLEQYQTVLAYYLKTKDSLDLAKTYNNIGNLYSDYGDHQKSLHYQLEGMKIRRALEDRVGLSSCYNNIALLYARKNILDSAIYYYQLALAIPEIEESPSLIGSINNNLGVAHKDNKNLDAAEHHLLIGLAFRDSVGDYHGSCQSRNNLSDVYRMKKNYVLAEQYAREALKLSKQYNYTEELWRNYLNLARIHKEQENYKEAYEFIELYSQVKDSLRNSEEIRKMAQVEVSHSYNQKLLQDSLRHEQEQELFLKEQELEKITLKEGQRRQQVIIWFSLAAGLILLVFVVFLVKNNREKSKVNTVISLKNTEIERQKETLLLKNREVLDSINYAKRIQGAILPTEEFMHRILPEHFLIFKPKDIISGDFYWLDEKENAIFLAVADCTGHGVPGAIVSVICANALSKSIEEGLDQTGKILDRTREIVVDQLSKNNSTVQDGMDISFLSITKNPTGENSDTISLEWSGANNALWILRSGDNTIEEIQANKQPIGKYANNTPFSSHGLTLKKGDCIYLFTDGYADQFGGEKGKKFKRANFKSLLTETNHKSMMDQKADVVDAFENWKGNIEQIDDVCVIGIRF